jgi:hypothetical protein
MRTLNTIQEEPEYLWEVAIKLNSGGWQLDYLLFKDGDIDKSFCKTGRKFLEEDGKLMEVK